jgi:hypothetical protein
MDKNTKKPWFRQKRYGYGWGLPLTWQGWLLLVAYFVFIILIVVINADKNYSPSDVLLRITLPVIIATLILLIITRITSGKPKWRWGDEKK